MRGVWSVVLVGGSSSASALALGLWSDRDWLVWLSGCWAGVAWVYLYDEWHRRHGE